MQRNFFFQRKLLVVVCVLLAFGHGVSQSSTSNNPAKTVYKCSIDGKVMFADTPCPGVAGVDAAAGRSPEQPAGRKLAPKEVARDKAAERPSEAGKPGAGASSQQVDLETRRGKLSNDARVECNRLDGTILESEAKVRSAQGVVKTATQQDLQVLRKRYKEFGC